MLLDLHTHSTASDGQYTPTELVKKAKEKQLEIYALTDHDTVNGIPEARRAAAACGVRFVPGLEISTREGPEVHILGLGINENAPAVRDACLGWQEDRQNRGERICAFLRTRGIEISMEEALAEAKGAALGRPHFAAILIRRGMAESVTDAFHKYLDGTDFHRLTDRVFPTARAAIDIIHAGGGTAVLAHPGLIRLGSRGQEELIRRIAGYGLDGLEVFYSRHEFIQTKHYRRIAADLGLIITAGSDFHGERVKPEIRMGMEVPAEKLANCRGYERFLPDMGGMLKE